MKAIVLCAGHATRMRPLTSYVAKAMVPVAGKPMLEHILGKLRAHGFTEAIVALSLHAEQVAHYFGDGSRWGMSLEYSVNEEPLGTAGEVDRMGAMIGDEENLLIHYGDILTDLDIGELVAEHKAHGADVTVGLVTGVRVHTGIAELAEDGRVASFVEKPPLQAACNAAVFAINRSALDWCGPGRDFSNDVFPEMIAAGRTVRGFVDENAYWHDVGRLSDLAAANELMGADN